jgi:flagellar biosynthetic protein FlhB
MADKSDRTEKPTPRRRRKAREEGRVARSREVSFAVTFTFLTILLLFQADYFLERLSDPFIYFWSSGFRNVGEAVDPRGVFLQLGRMTLAVAGPVIGAVVVLALGSLIAQGGFVFSAQPLQFKPEKLNPASNLKRIFSKNGLVQAARSLLLVAALVWVTWNALQGYLDQLQMMPVLSLGTILALWGQIAFSVAWRIALCLIILAAVDYAVQRYMFEEGLMMTKQEVKDDFKDTEGNPQIKGRIRRVQIEMVRRRMMTAAAEADVVVANPTHFAVALKYEAEIMAAPKVVAKGCDFLAARIRKVAEEHDIPVVEEPELARILYRTVEVGDEIPMDLYRAVAKILAYVYKLRRNRWH